MFFKITGITPDSKKVAINTPLMLLGDPEAL